MQLIKIKNKKNVKDRFLYLLPYSEYLFQQSFLELFENPYFPIDDESKQELVCLMIKDVSFDDREIFLILYNSKIYYFYFMPEEHVIELIF